MKYDAVSDGEEGQDQWILGLKMMGFSPCLIEKLAHFGVFQNDIPSHNQRNAALLIGATDQETVGLIETTIRLHSIDTYMDCEVTNMG